jgi:anthranilate/para-aminobenzoate synthase component I
VARTALQHELSITVKQSTLTMLVELRKQIQKECQNQARNLNSAQAHTEHQLRELEKEMSEWSHLISKARHHYNQRPILERMDLLEDERLQPEAQQKESQPQKIERDLSDDALSRFIQDFKNNLEQGDVERKNLDSVCDRKNRIEPRHPASASSNGFHYWG